MKSSRLVERAIKAEEAERERQKQGLGDFLGLLDKCLLDNERSSGEDAEYSIFPFIVPFCLPANVVEDYELPEDMRTLRQPKRQRKDRNADESDEEEAEEYPYYKELRQNRYVPPLCRVVMRPDDLEALVCSCNQEMGCGAYCQNRILLLECMPNRCPSICKAVVPVSANEPCGALIIYESEGDDNDSGDENVPEDKSAITFLHRKRFYCQNTVIQRRSYPATQVFGTQQRGFGLKLLEDIDANTIITEYLGEVITIDEMMERMKGMRDEDDFYFAALGGGLMLDAEPMGSIARFANHSCNPNCEMQKWMVLGEPRICLVSTRAMQAGDEVTYNYGYHSDGFDSVRMKRQICRCGEPNCCGTIGGKVVSSQYDNWRARARAVLSGVRRYPIDHVKGLVEEGTALGSICTAAEETAQLERIIDAGSRWLALAERLLDMEYIPPPESSSRGRRHVVNYSVASGMALLVAEKAPRSLRLDALTRWNSLIPRASKVDRSLATLLETATATASAAHGSICWDDFVGLTRDAIAAMPVRCVQSYRLLQLYQNYNNWCTKWFRGLATRAEVVTSDSKIGQLTWTSISRLGRLYGAEKIVRNDSFLALDFLEGRLYTYMRRAALRNGQWEEGYVDRALDQYFSASSEREEGIADLDLDAGGADGCSTTEELLLPSEEDALHCFCCLPELEGEVSVMSQCEVCKHWYHPHCVNLTAPKIRAGIFVCPLCTFRSRGVTTFSFAPETEWRILPQRVEDAGAHQTKKKAKVVAAASSPLRAGSDRPTDPLDAHAILCDTELSPLADIFIGSKEEINLRANAAAVSRDRISLQELQSAVEEEQRCVAIRRSPAATLARLSLHYATSWQRRARAFLAQQFVARYFTEGDASDIDWPTSDIGAAPASEDTSVEQEVAVLRKCIELYFELRILRVQPDEVHNLRQLAWLIGSGPLVTAHTGLMPVLTQAALDRVVDAGLALSCDNTLIWKRLSSLRQRAAAACRDALVVGSDALEDVLQAVVTLSRYVADLDRGFPYARLRSLALLRTYAPESEASDLHCWCREASFGAMIACDQCGIWFHTRCVGVAPKDIRKGKDSKEEMIFYCIACSETLGFSYKFIATFPIKY